MSNTPRIVNMKYISDISTFYYFMSIKGELEFISYISFSKDLVNELDEHQSIFNIFKNELTNLGLTNVDFDSEENTKLYEDINNISYGKILDSFYHNYITKLREPSGENSIPELLLEEYNFIIFRKPSDDSYYYLNVSPSNTKDDVHSKLKAFKDKYGRLIKNDVTGKSSYHYDFFNINEDFKTETHEEIDSIKKLDTQDIDELLNIYTSNRIEQKKGTLVTSTFDEVIHPEYIENENMTRKHLLYSPKYVEYIRTYNPQIIQSDMKHIRGLSKMLVEIYTTFDECINEINTSKLLDMMKRYTRFNLHKLNFLGKLFRNTDVQALRQNVFNKHAMWERYIDGMHVNTSHDFFIEYKIGVDLVNLEKPTIVKNHINYNTYMELYKYNKTMYDYVEGIIHEYLNYTNNYSQSEYRYNYLYEIVLTHTSINNNEDFNKHNVTIQDGYNQPPYYLNKFLMTLSGNDAVELITQLRDKLNHINMLVILYEGRHYWVD